MYKLTPHTYCISVTLLFHRSKQKFCSTFYVPGILFRFIHPHQYLPTYSSVLGTLVLNYLHSQYTPLHYGNLLVKGIHHEAFRIFYVGSGNGLWLLMFTHRIHHGHKHMNTVTFLVQKGWVLSRFVMEHERSIIKWMTYTIMHGNTVQS